MEIAYTPKAVKDISYWKKIGDKSIQGKILNLIASMEKTPFSGIGKPEALKHELTGYIG
ncbi:type II toxin-antitoxin system YoeB family toxin [Autumnicola edwardsiae]|uniref:Putative mRNA interferase YoeB n=1 Tax=Autumnicola edwardsiae TaxID=3075594 RepID=A0ABU3CXS2_9FLAO|nr:type II toxin-antitoxin system YoeB family toxin [Zunongwangia sp. F297]MDT0651121.1 type II toxin-antitoxin system YoeB family toxin [Zunongwangia sp. F297]